MGAISKIEWTESSWNPLRGTTGSWTCVKVSEGCAHCYAERFNVRLGGPKYRVGADTPRLDEKILLDPIRWRRPRKIFVCSMSDLFWDQVPVEWIARVFNVMASRTAECGKRHKHDEECWTGEPHTFQVLTKRAERMHNVLTYQLPEHVGEYWPGDSTLSLAMEFGKWPLPNVWLGVSAENQTRADERIPWLLKTPAAVRFVSLEPLLSQIDLDRWLWRKVMEREFPGVCKSVGFERTNALHWVIVGGESGGPSERALIYPCETVGCYHPERNSHPKQDALEWVRLIRDQCQTAGVSFHFKQWGGRTPKSGGRLLDGRTWDQFPEVGS